MPLYRFISELWLGLSISIRMSVMLVPAVSRITARCFKKCFGWLTFSGRPKWVGRPTTGPKKKR